MDVQPRNVRDDGSPCRSTLVSDWPCWIEVDLDAVRANVRALQAAAQPVHGVTAVVKAQAYGLGAEAVARVALSAGARGLAVARAAEAISLRKRGIDAPILVMGVTEPSAAEQVIHLDITTTVFDRASLDVFARAAQIAGHPARVHVKVDTGMTRLGAPPDEAEQLVGQAWTNSHILLEGFYTHFAAADDPDPFLAHQQLALFRSICHRLELEGVALGLRHAANSAGALRVPGAGLDTIRVGIALSGNYATSWVPRRDDIVPAASLKARIVRIHTPAIGTSIGYGRTYKVFRPMRVALLSVGYADGLPRACSNRGHVLVRGQRAPIVGAVSMDSTMVDVTHLPEAIVGDEAVILGAQGGEFLGTDEVAEAANTVPHELLIRLGSRVPRLYVESGRPAYFAPLMEASPVPLAEVPC